jgi:hypothetical protein
MIPKISALCDFSSSSPFGKNGSSEKSVRNSYRVMRPAILYSAVNVNDCAVCANPVAKPSLSLKIS